MSAGSEPGPAMQAAPAVERRTLEAHLARLEAIVGQLEREDLELDQALALFEEGIGHLRAARQILQETELRIERLLEDPDGGIVLEPMPRSAE